MKSTESYIAFLMVVMLIFPMIIVTIPMDPDFSSIGITIPDVINLDIDNKEDKILDKDIEDIFMKTLIYEDDEDDEIAFLIMDTYYYKASLDKYMRLLKDNKWTHRGSYVNSFNDCDDYAFKIYGLFCQDEWSGLPTGVIIWKKPRHAEAFFIDEDLAIWIVNGYNDVELLSNYQKDFYRVNIIII